MKNAHENSMENVECSENNTAAPVSSHPFFQHVIVGDNSTRTRVLEAAVGSSSS